LTALLRLAIRNENSLDKAIFGGKLMGLWYKLKHLLRPNTRKGSKKNIHAHYDIGNNFYALWLDPSWTYSSGIFYGDFAISLEHAQQRKYQRIIDVLELKAGDRVLEIGCGWGGFAEHAASRDIHVHGVTISQSQLDFANARIAKKGLSNLVNLEMCDYRDLKGSYDAIVSIEMFEAVGEKFWPTYFSTVQQRLKPNGMALIQSITIDEARFERYRAGTDFIQQYIFPGGMLPSPTRFEKIAARHNLTSVEQFAFGPDYAETLRKWSKNFESERERITEQGFDMPFQRIWQLYFAYCEAGFDEGRTDVVQFLLKKEIPKALSREESMTN
jgi:cyclopropane-fatty-acyl-phospholipid synthase